MLELWHRWGRLQARLEKVEPHHTETSYNDRRMLHSSQSLRWDSSCSSCFCLPQHKPSGWSSRHTWSGFQAWSRWHHQKPEACCRKHLYVLQFLFPQPRSEQFLCWGFGSKSILSGLICPWYDLRCLKCSSCEGSLEPPGKFGRKKNLSSPQVPRLSKTLSEVFWQFMDFALFWKLQKQCPSLQSCWCAPPIRRCCCWIDSFLRSNSRCHRSPFLLQLNHWNLDQCISWRGEETQYSLIWFLQFLNWWSEVL